MSADDDILTPLKTLIDAVGLLQAPVTSGTAGIIESTTLEVTKQVKALITAAGGIAVVAGGASSFWAATAGNPVLAAVLVASVGIVLASAIIGLSLVMNGDVRGRAAVTTEQIEARGFVVNRFLESVAPSQWSKKAISSPTASSAKTPTASSEFKTAFAAYGTSLNVTSKGGLTGVVEGVEWDDERGLRIRVQGDWLDLDEISSFHAP
jgi:hypothetical protein